MNRYCLLIGALMIVGCCISGAAVAAEPIVIYDTGFTRPLPNPGIRFQQTPPTPQSPSAYELALLFPVRTPSMRPGSAVPARDAALLERLRRLPGPLFLIGSDDLSLRWLSERQQQLIELGAIGFLVDAETLADYQAVLSIAGAELVIVPSSAEQLAEVLGLRHYPVLLTREGIVP